jgi:hypothetical protein
MKKTDLDKLNAQKLKGRMKGAGTPARYGRGAAGGDTPPELNSLVEKLLRKGLADRNRP